DAVNESTEGADDRFGSCAAAAPIAEDVDFHVGCVAEAGRLDLKRRILKIAYRFLEGDVNGYVVGDVRLQNLNGLPDRGLDVPGVRVMLDGRAEGVVDVQRRGHAVLERLQVQPEGSSARRATNSSGRADVAEPRRQRAGHENVLQWWAERI